MASYCAWLLCAPCRACSKCCETLFETPCCPAHRPSPVFLGYTILLNLVPGVVAFVIAILATTEGKTCSAKSDTMLKVFMFVAAGCSLFFVAFSIRAYSVLQPKPGAVHDPNRKTGISNFLRGSQCGRFQAFFMKDIFMFMYFLFAPFTIVWCVLGLIWARSVEKDYIRKYGNFDAALSQECYWVMIRMAKAQAIIMLVYLLGTMLVVPLSWCVEQVRAGSRRDVEQGQQGAVAGYVGQPGGFAGQPGVYPSQAGTYVGQPAGVPMAGPVSKREEPYLAAPMPASVVGHGSYGLK